MTEKEEETVPREDLKLQEQLYESHTADAHRPNYDDLEHLKQQYIDGELTGAEFEQRLEQLDSLDEPSARDDTLTPSDYLVWGFAGGAAPVLMLGLSYLAFEVAGPVLAFLTPMVLSVGLLIAVWRW